MAALRPWHSGRAIRAGRQNTRIWVASMLTGVRQTSAQNGGYRTPSARWLIAGDDRLGDVADDRVGAVVAGIQVGVVYADRPASAAVGGQGCGGEAGELAPGQAARLGIVHGGELAGGEHVEIGVQPP